MKTDNIDSIFRDALVDAEFLPPQNIWGKIEAQLPSEKKIFFPVWLKWSIAATLVGVAVFSSILFLQSLTKIKEQLSNNSLPKNSVVYQKSNNEQQQLKNEVPAKENNAATDKSNPITNKNNVQIAYNPAKTNISNPVNEINNTKSNPTERLIAGNNKVALEILNFKLLRFFPNDEPEFNHQSKVNAASDALINDLLKQQMYFVQGWHIGLKTEFSNSWIVAKQLDMQNSTVSFKYTISPGLAYGGLLGYDFNNKFGVQLELHNVSQNIPAYETNGNYALQNNMIAVNYGHIPLLFKLKWHPLRGVERKPVVMNYMLGIQYGWLKSKNIATPDFTTVSSEELKLKQLNFSEWDIVAGINYDIYFNAHFFFSAGARAAFGGNLNATSMDNISTKNSNLTLGIEAALHYKLPFHKKK